MARNEHWRIAIDTDRGQHYHAAIYAEGSVSTVTQLIPTLSPIYTADDSTDDLFTPIRYASGYLRFVDTGGLSDAIIPEGLTDRFVEIVDGNNSVVWIGYLSPQSFESPWGTVQERELPIVGALRILDSVYWPTNLTGTYSVAYVIRKCIESMGLGTNYLDYIFLPHHLGDPANFLDIKVQGMNFLEMTDNDQGDVTFEDGSTMSDVLGSICQLFGLQARLFGKSLYFSDYPLADNFDSGNVNKFQRITITNLNAHIDYGTAISSSTYLKSSLSLELLNYRGTGNSFGRLLGKRSVTFKSNINEVKSIIRLPSEKVSAISKQGTVVMYQDSVDNSYYTRSVMRGSSAANRTIGDDTCSTALTYYTPAYEYSIVPSGESSLSKTWTPAIKLDNFDSSHKLKFTSRVSGSFTNGLLYIKGDIKHTWIKRLTCQLKIGDKYYNGNRWQTTASTFYVQVDKGVNDQSQAGDDASIRDTSAVIAEDYDGKPGGYGIVVNASTILSGVVEFSITGTLSNSSGTERKDCADMLTDLEVGFIRHIDDINIVAKDENEYKATLAKQYIDDYNISCQLASDQKNKIGYGKILNADNTYLATYPFTHGSSSVSSHPEQEVIDAAAAHYGKPVRTVRATVSETNHPDSTDLLYLDDHLTLLVVAAVSRDYIHDEATIYAIEL